jgi:hypothetical protein
VYRTDERAAVTIDFRNGETIVMSLLPLPQLVQPSKIRLPNPRR